MKKLILSSVTSLGILVGIASGKAMSLEPHSAEIAQMPHNEMQDSEPTFRRIDQPLWIKGGVAIAGVSLIGLELWWFLFNRSRARKASVDRGIQEATIKVDGGYEPNHVTVSVGQPVRLNFDRRDPNSCLDAVRLPEFHIAQSLPLNRVTSIEFTPEKPGEYEFTCGMNMFRGVIEVQAEQSPKTTSAF